MRSIHLALVAACGMAVPSVALPMDFEGHVSASTIYTDNVTLAPEGSEQDDWIFRVDPTINLSSVGRRYDFRLDYTLEALYYQDQPDSTEVYNEGSVFLDLEILDEHLFLNTLATISQVVIDPEQPFSSTNLPQIDNRTDAVRYQAGPEWRQDIGDSHLNIRYDLGHVDYDDETLQDGDYENLNIDWDGPEKDRGLTWSARHEYRKYDYEISPDAVRQLAELTLIYEMGRGWAPFVSGGMESDVEDRQDASLTEGIWRAGLRRRTARTDFEAFVGERSFGSSWGASFERQYGPDSGDIFSVSYREIPRTNEELDRELAIPSTPPGTTPPPGPVVPPPVVPPDVVGPGTGTFYLSKRGDFILARSFNRNAVSLNAFYEDNENLDDEVTDADSTRQVGLAAAWAYQFGVRTVAVLDGYYANREFSNDTDDNLFRARLSLQYQLGSRTLLAGWIGREQRSGLDDDADYDENQVGLTIGRSF